MTSSVKGAARGAPAGRHAIRSPAMENDDIATTAEATEAPAAEAAAVEAPVAEAAATEGAA